MRFSPFFSSLLYTFSNLTRVSRTYRPVHLPTVQATHLRSMSFLGALFGSSVSKAPEMSYPDKRSNDEWRAVLNKGNLICSYLLYTTPN